MAWETGAGGAAARIGRGATCDASVLVPDAASSPDAPPRSDPPGGRLDRVRKPGIAAWAVRGEAARLLAREGRVILEKTERSEDQEG